jgi:hypothetical protein
MVDYMCRFRDAWNKCYRLTIGEKDLTELAFVELSTALKDMMDGQDFTNVNQVLQRVVGYESHAREPKSYVWIRENPSKDKPGVNVMEEDSASEDDTEVCMAKWVDTPKDNVTPQNFKFWNVIKVH